MNQRWVLGVLILSATCSVGMQAFAGCPEGQSAGAFGVCLPKIGENEQIRIRAVQPLPDKAVAAIAQLASPTTLSQARYPDAKDFTARQVIEILCGSFSASYWEATKRQNHISNLSTLEPLHAAAYSIRWPACAYILKRETPIRVKVRPGDTAASVYEELTGAVGTGNDVAKFFEPQKGQDLGNLHAGQILVPSHATVSTILKAQDAVKVSDVIDRAFGSDRNRYLHIDTGTPRS